MLPSLSSANTLHAPHLDTSNNNASQHIANKRGTSMIFRIEHLLPPTVTTTAGSMGAGGGASPPTSLLSARALTSAAHTSASRRDRDSLSGAQRRAKQARSSAGCGSVPGHGQSHGTSGVYVAQFTAKDTLSESMATIALMSATCYGDAERLAPTARAYCTLTTEGTLAMTPALLRRVKLSEDIHSYNAIFELQGGQSVRVRVVRDVAADEEIVAWFGEELTLLMAIPFLTPLNIQGNKRYTCHLCHLTFETPNPLKVHLALGCGRHSMDILWMRLHYAVKATTFTREQQLQLQPHAPPPPPVPPRYASSAQHSPAMAASTASSTSPTTTPPPPTMPTLASQRFSAFKPITSSASGLAAQPMSLATSMPHSHGPVAQHGNATTSTASMSFLPSLSSATLPAMSLLQAPSNGPLNAAAQIEAIVSNMGASKQGHLCIYCGKVYSRKYGLKIHIRTHTGFKPLKCKFCLRPFGDPSNLNKHVRLHLQTNATSSGPTEGYRCHLCHKTLARRRDLQRHIESRHAMSAVADKTAS